MTECIHTSYDTLGSCICNRNHLVGNYQWISMVKNSNPVFSRNSVSYLFKQNPCFRISPTHQQLSEYRNTQLLYYARYKYNSCTGIFMMIILAYIFISQKQLDSVQNRFYHLDGKRLEIMRSRIVAETEISLQRRTESKKNKKGCHA